jgi:transposase
MTGVQALERAAPTQPLRPGLVLHFTPKHASWLNQIELWFSILARKVLHRANFTSEANLKQRISAFIDFFNKTLADNVQGDLFSDRRDGICRRRLFS